MITSFILGIVCVVNKRVSFVIVDPQLIHHKRIETLWPRAG